MRNSALFDRCSKRQQEWLLLLSCSLLQLVVGLSTSGPAFANSMRVAFGLKQSELEVAMGLPYYGAVLIFVSGLLHDRWGSRVTIVVGGIASTLASLAVTLAFAFPKLLYGRPWPLWCLMFIYGHTLYYTDVASVAAAVSGISEQRKGISLGVVENCFSLGPFVTALLHYLLFQNMFRSPDSENAVGAMAVQTAMTAVIHAFAFVFVGQPRSSEQSELTPINQKKVQVKVKEDSTVQQVNPTALSSWDRGETTAQYLHATIVGCLNWPCFLLIFGFGLSAAQATAVWLNVTTMTRSIGLSGYDLFFFLVPRLLSFPWRIGLGYLSDRFVCKSYQRAALYLSCDVAFGIPALLLITIHWIPGSSPLGVTLSSIILSEFVFASSFTLGSLVLSQVTTDALFGRMFSLCVLIETIVSLPLSLQSGIIYDMKAAAFNATVSWNSTSGSPVCMGQDCYTQGNIANAVCLLIAAVCLSSLTLLLHCRRKRQEKQDVFD